MSRPAASQGVAFVAALLALSACSGMEEPLPPLPAEIVGVEVTPDPVAPLDTALFRVLTSRPVQSFNWILWDGQSEFRTRDTITWIAPAAAGAYQQTVRISELGVTLDRYDFDVEVSDE